MSDPTTTIRLLKEKLAFLANAVLAWRTNGKPDMDWLRAAQEEAHALLAKLKA
jgi:hypothetical protein